MAETEMLPSSALPGSLNRIVSLQHMLRRPFSLSDSYVLTPENVERAQKEPFLEQPQHATVPIESDIPVSPTRDREIWLVNLIVKLVFHITLISVFETVFFFLYVSTLENNGITKTISTFVNGAVAQCTNLTAQEIQWIDAYIVPQIPIQDIIERGTDAYNTRMAFNTSLFAQSWYYVGGLGGACVALAIYTRVRALPIQWKSILIENSIMVLLLALYEYVFFETIIYPYRPLSTQEIEKNTILEFQTMCGIGLNATVV